MADDPRVRLRENATEALEDVEHWRSASRTARDERDRSRDREFESET